MEKIGDKRLPMPGTPAGKFPHRPTARERELERRYGIGSQAPADTTPGTEPTLGAQVPAEIVQVPEVVASRDSFSVVPGNLADLLPKGTNRTSR